MSYTVIVLPEAEEDAERIYRWLVERSPAGANRWYAEFLNAIRGLESQAEMYGLAPENEHVEEQIRQTFFKTRKGLRYRVLFAIVETKVYVLHVRGPGQRLLRPQEVRKP
jgi:plasmid stabilization system protein ParE